MSRKLCYIAGPMTGYPGFNYVAFDAARDDLINCGWDVISPADLDRVNLGIDFSTMYGTEDLSAYRTKFARQDIEALLKVEAVFLLPGWEKSTGAMNEARIATMLGIVCRDYITGDAINIDAPFAGPAPAVVAPRNARSDILLGANDVVNGDRNAQYGDPIQDFRRTAAFWNAYLGLTAIEPHDVAAMMALLKLSRIAWSEEKQDSWLDLAGYAACGWHCVVGSEVEG